MLDKVKHYKISNFSLINATLFEAKSHEINNYFFFKFNLHPIFDEIHRLYETGGSAS